MTRAARKFNTRISILIFALTIVATSHPASAQESATFSISVDPSIEKDVPPNLLARLKASDFFIVEGPDGKRDYFRRGRATLLVAPNLPIESHLAEAGLQK